MKRTLVVIFLYLSLTPPAWSGWDEAVEAYQRKDYATALREYRPLAERGDIRAQNMLGWIYHHGMGVTRDRAEAMKWYGKALRLYRKAAAQGDVDAQHRIGLAYDSGRGVRQDYVEALKWYRLAAGQGHIRAQTALGSMHGYGIGVPENYREQEKWYELAAWQGDIWAQSNLATLYLNGAGEVNLTGNFIPKNLVKAAKWYSRAAEQGHAFAQEQLAWLYESGKGVPQDYATAAKWYLKAAEQGNASAQEQIGDMYANGHGVPKDNIEAYKWLNLASAEGSRRVRGKRDSVANTMTPADVTNAQKLARQWLAAHNEFSALQKAADAGSGRSRFALAELYVARGMTLKAEREAAKLLRKIVADEQQEYLLPAMLLMGKIRQSLRREFPNISDAAIKNTHGSVGIALIRKGDRNTGMEVTIREALLLNTAAQIQLGLVYQYSVKGYRRHDPRILSFFRKTASEKLPRSMLVLGKILLNGWGVEADVIQAKRLLEASGFGEAYMELAAYAFSQKNTGEIELYLKKAAAHDIPKAHYNLGVLAKNRGAYNEAVRHYKRTLELEPEYQEASLNLAQLYSGEFGIMGKEQRAFEMMKKLADEANGPISATAQLNLGYFYLDGTGVDRSINLAKKYLAKAAAGGVEKAKEKLQEIQ